MQAIVTKRHPASWTISATAPGGRVRIPDDPALAGNERDFAAVKALCVKMGWKDGLVHGPHGMPDGVSQVWVLRKVNGLHTGTDWEI